MLGALATSSTGDSLRLNLTEIPHQEWDAEGQTPPLTDGCLVFLGSCVTRETRCSASLSLYLAPKRAGQKTLKERWKQQVAT